MKSMHISKRFTAFVLFIALLIGLCACGQGDNNKTQTSSTESSPNETNSTSSSTHTVPEAIPSAPNTLSPSVWLFDSKYISTGQRISAEIKESDFLGTIASSVSITEWPSQDGQTNLEYLVGSPYALHGDGIAVRWGNEGWWMQFRNQAAIYAEESGDVHIGMVKIISGGKEYAPLQNWIYSLIDGMAGDGFRKQPESIADALPAIPLEEDFHIVIDGNDFLGQSYALYKRTDGVFNWMYFNAVEFTAPTEPGEYILSMEVSWGNENRYEGFQYLFKLIK